MRYPIRHPTHVTETTSFKRLDQGIPYPTPEEARGALEDFVAFE